MVYFSKILNEGLLFFITCGIGTFTWVRDLTTFVIIVNKKKKNHNQHKFDIETFIFPLITVYK